MTKTEKKRLNIQRNALLQLTDQDMFNLGAQYGALGRKYERAMTNYLDKIEPLTDDEFWELMPKFQKDMARSKNESARWCREFVRSLCFDSAGASYHPYNDDFKSRQAAQLDGWETAAKFLSFYNKLYHKLYKRLWNVPGLDRGDDGYSDLCDSLPFAGRTVIEAEVLKNFQYLECLVTEEWRKFCLYGENYIRQGLQHALTEIYADIVSREPY